MIALANFMGAIATILYQLLNLVVILIIARVVVSWVNADPYNPIVRFITSSTDPFLRPLRKRLPLIGPGIDISPIILILVVVFIQSFVVQTLADYAGQIKMKAMSPTAYTSSYKM